MTHMYKQDGVDVVAGDKFSTFAAELCASTYGNSRFVEIHDLSQGHFRGPRGWTFKNLPKGCIETGVADGVGTKVIVLDAAGQHHHAARDLVAMCAGDITRKGGLPLIFFNLLDTSSLGEPGFRTDTAFRNMILGLREAVTSQQMVMLGGETAELGVCVSSDNPNAVAKFNWAGFCVGVYHPDKMILGDKVAAGQVLVALRDDFRSNGWSSIRKAFARKFGPQWFNHPDADKYVKQVATPSALYDLLLAVENGWFQPDFKALINMTLIAHVTGGSFRSKLGEDLLFRRGLSAVLDDLWEPSEIMRLIAEWRGGTDEEIYETWNGGQGAIVAMDEEDADLFTQVAAGHGVDAKVAGRILQENRPRLVIHSKFNGGEIVYEPQAV